MPLSFVDEKHYRKHRQDVLKRVFEYWKGRLLDYWHSGGEYME
jgi:hypothetical protein